MTEGEAASSRKAEGGALFVALAFQFLFAAAGLAIGSQSGVPALAGFALDQTALLWGAGATALLIGQSVLTLRLFPRFAARLEESARRSLQTAGIRLTWPVILVLSAAAGVAEEILFRGALQGWAQTVMPLPLAILLPNLLFTALHPHGLLHMAYVLAVGLIIGTVFAVSGSLLAVMIAHALYDVYALCRLKQEPGRV